MRNYKQTGVSVGELVEEKNAAYGSAFERSGEIMRVLYPDGISADQMVDALATVRVIDKLFRIANKKDAFDESPWRDVAGYGILMATLDEERVVATTKVPETFVDSNTGDTIRLEDIRFIRYNGAGSVEVSAEPLQGSGEWASDDGRTVSESYFENGEVSGETPPLEAYDADEMAFLSMQERREWRSSGSTNLLTLRQACV